MLISTRPLLTCLTLALLGSPVAAQLASGTEFSPRVPGPAETSRLERARELARVDGKRGAYVLWVHSAEERQVSVLVAATYPDRPLIANEFVRTHDPIEVFLAVADLDQEVPAALLAESKLDARSFDRERRKALRDANLALLAQLPEPSAGDVAAKSAGCSASFRSWVGSVFGSTTCGDPTFDGFAWTYPTHTYCNDGPGGCPYTLGASDSCSPGLLSCDIVTGTAHTRRQRLTDVGGSLTMAYPGHWAHYLGANCSGNGPIQWYTRRGNTIYGPYAINVGGALHWPNGQGTWNVPTIAADFVSYGTWNDGIEPSGPTYLANETWVENNLGTDDRAILCGDVRNQYDMSAQDCHGPNISFCFGNGDCDSDCWNCVGGSCF
jgi:hypothetical protein